MGTRRILYGKLAGNESYLTIYRTPVLAFLRINYVKARCFFSPAIPFTRSLRSSRHVGITSPARGEAFYKSPLGFASPFIKEGNWIAFSFPVTS